MYKNISRIVKSAKLTRLNAALPQSWGKAAGLMRGKRKALQQHISKIRREWDRER
ncbi:MAG TPA: hypothetical protein VJA27_01425 [Patescibacteria group bacterium]|nr:hypothetical protein [Patescibacteria group bacterium]